jgi:hypothetical protein
MRVTRPAVARRRTGYLTGAVLNTTLLVLINVTACWRALPFLTADAGRVLTFVNASLLLGLLANLVLATTDPPALAAAVNLVVTAATLVALARVWQVFPFDVPDASVSWPLIVRAVLGVAMAVEMIALVAHTAALVIRPVAR